MERGIRTLRDRLRGEVILPGEPAYEQARRVSNGSIDRHPAVIARCADTDDVRRAMTFGRDLQAAVSGFVATAILQFGSFDVSYWLTATAVSTRIAGNCLTVMGLLCGAPGIAFDAVVLLFLSNPISGLATGPEGSSEVVQDGGNDVGPDAVRDTRVDTSKAVSIGIGDRPALLSRGEPAGQRRAPTSADGPPSSRDQGVAGSNPASPTAFMQIRRLTLSRPDRNTRSSTTAESFTAPRGSRPRRWPPRARPARTGAARSPGGVRAPRRRRSSW